MNEWIRNRLILVSVLGFALVGCPAPESGGGGDDDDSANPGDDDDFFPDDDDDDMNAETDGTVSLMYSEAGGMDFGVNFAATFNTVVTPATPGYMTNIPVGMDDCAITHFTQDELMGGDPGEYVSESAGTISLSGAGISVDIDPQNQDGVIGYAQQFPTGQFDFGVDYAVSAAGDEFPAFSGTLQMTAQPALVTPEAQGMFQVLGGDFPVEWAGYDGSEAGIFMTFMGQDQNGAVILCIINNDGAFTIPGNLVDQLPSGSGSLMVEQYNWSQTTAGGRTVAIMAGAGVIASGVVP